MGIRDTQGTVINCPEFWGALISQVHFHVLNRHRDWSSCPYFSFVNIDISYEMSIFTNDFDTAYKLCTNKQLCTIVIRKRGQNKNTLNFPTILTIKIQWNLSLRPLHIRTNFQNCHIWAWNLASGQSSRSCTYALFLPQGVEIELICSMGNGFWNLADFRNCHIWVSNLAISQSPRSCTYTPFLPQGLEIELIFALRAAISMLRAFSKLPYLGMKFGKWPNFQKLHIWALLPKGVPVDFFFFRFYKKWT